MFFDYFLFRLFCNSILISSQSHSHTSEKPNKFENSNLEVPKFTIMTCCLALYHEIWFRMRQPKIEKHMKNGLSHHHSNLIVTGSRTEKQRPNARHTRGCMHFKLVVWWCVWARVLCMQSQILRNCEMKETNFYRTMHYLMHKSTGTQFISSWRWAIASMRWW